MNPSPETIGNMILTVKNVEKVSICEAADRVFARLATRGVQPQNPQGAERYDLGPATPEAWNGARYGDI